MELQRAWSAPRTKVGVKALGMAEKGCGARPRTPFDITCTSTFQAFHCVIVCFKRHRQPSQRGRLRMRMNAVPFQALKSFDDHAKHVRCPAISALQPWEKPARCSLGADVSARSSRRIEKRRSLEAFFEAF